MLVEWNKPCAVTVPRAIEMVLARFFSLNQHMCDMLVTILTFNMMLGTTLQDMVKTYSICSSYKLPEKTVLICIARQAKTGRKTYGVSLQVMCSAHVTGTSALHTYVLQLTTSRAYKPCCSSGRSYLNGKGE